FFDLPTSSVMMVAAHPGDLDAAKALGLKTAYVHRPLEYGPGKATTPPAAGTYDFSAKDMRDLASQLNLYDWLGLRTTYRWSACRRTLRLFQLRDEWLRLQKRSNKPRKRLLERCCSPAIRSTRSGASCITG